MKREFLLGDRVRILNHEIGNGNAPVEYRGLTGVVVGIDCSEYKFEVYLGGGVSWYYKEDQIELIEEAKQEPKKYIRRFPSGAVRSDSTGRPRPDWVTPYGIEEVSMVLVNNANDFGSLNYMKGIPEEACVESLCRHVEEAKEALYVTKDMDTFRRVMQSVGFNALATLHTIVAKERGVYVEQYSKTELIELEQYKKNLNK